ncbi:MAG: hypothetical protein WD512_17625 [Candidatus Paceibacterota bacterium]
MKDRDMEMWGIPANITNEIIWPSIYKSTTNRFNYFSIVSVYDDIGRDSMFVGVRDMISERVKKTSIE